MRNISLTLIEEDLSDRLEPYLSAGISPILIVVRSFFKDEEWIDYLTYILDVEAIKGDFHKTLSRYFDVIYVGSTSGIDLFAIVLPKFGADVSDSEALKNKVESLEDDLIAVFLSDVSIRRIQKQVDIFRNPFRTFVEFAVGYAFLRSADTDDIVEAVKLALGRADMRRRIKIDELSRELYHILDTGSVYTYFQPIIDVKEKKIYAHEALVRGPEGSLLRSPALLFKIAHYNGMEMDLDRIVRRKHIETFKNYVKENKNALLSINLGPFTPMFIDDIEKDLKYAGIPKENIIWEVSEKTYIDDFAAFARVIDLLVSEGYQVAVDDFGAGATTFKLIFSINTRIVKIDRSFIENVSQDVTKQMFLERLIGCLYQPDTLLFIEGVETEKEFQALLHIGYRYYQGYYMFRPAPELVDDEKVKNLLKDVEYDIPSMRFPGYFLS
ncbi:EAL domain-containing protein [bacterium 3DAC]|nr:EAL domain-containing protein [bacterium 3DAC]